MTTLEPYGDWVETLNEWASNPSIQGYVPVYPGTLRTLANAIAALRAERDAHHDAAACVRNDIKEMQRNLGAAERERDALREQVEAFRREQIARSKIDPVTRLHNLCDHLADQRRESPFTAESLELADASYKELCADNAALRAQIARAIRLYPQFAECFTDALLAGKKP